MAKIQQRFVRLEKLLQVEPFKIVGLWSNGETRLHDFSSSIDLWKVGTNKELKKLTVPKVFNSAFVKNGTLAFAGSTVRIPGVPDSQPVDFDRRSLYTDSQLIGNVVSFEDALRHQKSRTNRRRMPKTLREKSPLERQSIDSELIRKIYQQIGNRVTPLILIGDSLVELD